MKEGMDRRGQQMTLGTIIMIVLGIVVLVFLIYGFSTGWGNLWERITNLSPGDSNVATIQDSCKIACQTGGTDGFDFKDLERTIRTGSQEFTSTCARLATDPPTMSNGTAAPISVASCSGR